jgi:6-phosphogluconolactonase
LYERRLPNGILQNLLAQWAFANSRVLWFADERIVPLTDVDSNYGGLKKQLLDHLDSAKHGTPEVNHLDDAIPFDADSDLFASSYEKVLVKSLGSEPSLDLVLLGCGPDGHTCSLFPGHKLLQEESRFVDSLDDSPKPPPRRITLTKPSLRLAQNIAFVAEGAGKAPVLREIFETPQKGLPSSQVNELARKPVHWFVNLAAIDGVRVKNSAV